MEFTKAENKELTEAERKSFGEKLYTLRKKNGLSQQEVAEALQVSRQAVSRWEVGTSVPTMENLVALSKLYDLLLDDLINNKSNLEQLIDRKEKESKEQKENEIKDSNWKNRAKRNRSILIGISLILLFISIGFTMAFFLQKEESISMDSLMIEQSKEESTSYDFSFSLDWK